MYCRRSPGAEDDTIPFISSHKPCGQRDFLSLPTLPGQLQDTAVVPLRQTSLAAAEVHQHLADQLNRHRLEERCQIGRDNNRLCISVAYQSRPCLLGFPPDSVVQLPCGGGQLGQLLHQRAAGLLLQGRQQPVPDVVPRVGEIDIGMVLPPPPPAFRKVCGDLVTSYAEQRTRERCTIIEPPRRPDARQPAQTRPTAQPMDDSLRIVVLLVPRGNPRTPALGRHFPQAGDAQLSRRCLDRQPVRTGVRPHIDGSGDDGKSQLGCLLNHEPLVTITLRPAQFVIDMGADKLRINELSGAERLDDMQQCGRIGPAGHRQ